MAHLQHVSSSISSTMGKSCELSEGIKTAIVRLHKSGHSASEIAVSLRLNS